MSENLEKLFSSLYLRFKMVFSFKNMSTLAIIVKIILVCISTLIMQQDRTKDHKLM